MSARGDDAPTGPAEGVPPRGPVPGLAALVFAAGLLLAAFIAARATAPDRTTLAVQTPLRVTAGSAIPYFIADGVAPSGFRASDRELARWALDAWQRGAGGALRFAEAPEDDALIRLYWAGPSSGAYGETRSLEVGGGRRGAEVLVRPDMASLGPDIAGHAAADPLLRETIVYLTCLHELGHALGMQHTNDFHDVMYFFGYGGDIVEFFNRYRRQLHSRADITTVSGLSEGDLRALRALYEPTR